MLRRYEVSSIESNKEFSLFTKAQNDTNLESFILTQLLKDSEFFTL